MLGKLVVVFFLALFWQVEGQSECGSTTEVKEGQNVFFETPHFSDGKYYPNSYKCTWKFKADSESDCKLGLTCPQFSLFNLFCTDSLKVTGSNRNQVTFCGRKGPRNFVMGKEGEVSFDSDFISSSRGFRCSTYCTKDGQETPPYQTQECTCGQKSPKRIVNGVEAEINEFPWIAALTRPGKSSPFCGGSLINSKYVLTAAHCTEGQSPSGIEVVLNEHDTKTDDETDHPVIRRKVVNITSHSQHNSRQDYDVSLLELDEPVDEFMTNGLLSPVCLPKADDLSKTYEGETVTVAGWGTLMEGGSQATKLQKVNVTVISNARCNFAYFGLITERMICAAAPGKDSCQGDSGGPCMKLDGEKYTQVGIVSWGFGCARPVSPGVYSRVTEFVPWIIEQTKDKGNYCSK